jgi:hypothetical protein
MKTPSPTLILLENVHHAPIAAAATERITNRKLHTDTTRLSMGDTSSFYSFASIQAGRRLACVKAVQRLIKAPSAVCFQLIRRRVPRIVTQAGTALL